MNRAARLPFFGAPHRVMFFGGAAQLLLGMAFWGVDLGGRFAGLYPSPAWPQPAVWLHAVLMIDGAFPFFVFGFLMTAMPKWLGAPPLGRSAYLPPFGLLAAGWLTFYGGLLAPPLLVVGIGVAAAGWCWGGGVLLRLAVAAAGRDRDHAFAAIGALVAGVAGFAAFGVGFSGGGAGWVRVGIEFGVWGFLLPVFFTVCHRMLPVFSAAVIRDYRDYRPRWLLWTVLACLACHGVAASAGHPESAFVADAVAAALAFRCSAKWRLGSCFDSPLLAMHHVAFLWLGGGLAMAAVQEIAHLAGGGWGGLAPLHALTAGFCTSMLLGMAIRVTLGHSGRALADDRRGWPLFWAFQGVVLVRLGAEAGPPGNLAYVVAVAGWLAVFAAWCLSYLPIYWRARPDGQPG